MAGSDVHGDREIARGHLAIAPEADALVLVTLDPSGLLRGAVLRAGPHAGVALGAAERLRVGRCAQIREDVVSHEFGVAQVCAAAAHLRVVGRQRHVI